MKRGEPLRVGNVIERGVLVPLPLNRQRILDPSAEIRKDTNWTQRFPWRGYLFEDNTD